MTPIAIVIILLALACGVWLFLAIARRRIRFQFSLRSLLAATAAIALVLGLFIGWPRSIFTVNIPRIDARPGHIDLARDALVLEISRRWGHTVMGVSPRNGFNEASKAELFWLDSGNLRHVTIAEKGRVSAITTPAPNEWPLLIGVVEYHPEAIEVVARWVLRDGRNGGASVTYDANDSTFDGGIEKWGKSFLEKTLEIQPPPRSAP